MALVATVATAGTGQAQDAGQQPPTGWAARSGLTTMAVRKAPLRSRDLAAHVAIQQAFAQYATALDDGDSAVMRSVFAADAEWIIQFWNGKIPARIKGAEEIVKISAELLKSQGDQRRHLISNIVVQNLTANTADAVATGLVTRTADNVTTLAGSAVYSASFRKGKDGIWRFTRLTVGLDNTEAGKGRAR